jgi:hypothetical protein
MAYPEADGTADEEDRKRRIIGRAKAMADSPEYSRHPNVALLIHQAAAIGLRGADVEIFRAAYGDPTGRAFWEAFLSEPMPVSSLVQMLSAYQLEKMLSTYRASAEQRESNCAENEQGLEKGVRVSDAELVVIRALRDAAQNGEAWFIGETASLLSIGYGYGPFVGLEAIKLHPREAVAWLATKPKRKHLVPPSLQAFLETGPCDLPTNQPERTGTEGRPTPQTADAGAKQSSCASPTKAGAPRPGPKPLLRKHVEDAMRAALARDEMTVEDLKALLQKELAAMFGVNAGRTTCVEARKKVLLEFAGV